ncbi:uncharacterized protein LOC119690459 [Plutella xylostella]|uniref:uncharacterized protein LOC119690459 n=1 Tax=Plutella xylostella TaxID=51655 RepID=UPI002032C1B5|nr:uncharacterized protein LOC119690459 [Plutella xylostella]
MIAPTSQTTTKDRVTPHKSFHVMTNHKEESNARCDNIKPNTQVSCTFCNGTHYLYNCKEFSKLTVEDRHQFVQKSNLCFNCLIPNHTVFRCKQRTSCRICRRKHHSLLHKENKTNIENNNTPSRTETTESQEDTDNNITSHYSREETTNRTVLLATALIDVVSSSGESHVFRALIDQGSEASFVTARASELLGLKKTKINGTVSGVGERKHELKHKVSLSVLSESKMPIPVDAYVLKTISSTLPAKKVDINWPELKSLKLADPTCHVPGKIDILLGADIFSSIIEEGLVRLQDGLIAQKTCLGWILSGRTNNTQETQPKITSLLVRENNDLLRQFWEIETDLYNKKKILTKEEEECETIYKNTTKRDEDGRYIVHLPLKQTIEETIQTVGDTKQQAIKRFIQLERKLERNKNLKEQYNKVIDEYIDMNHMKKIENEEDNKLIYLPHHAVIRDDKDTTKVRVVFDASAKGSNGRSLNETMMVGPVLQPDLRSLIISWRKHKVCVVGDIVKMYRMVKTADDFTNLQCIVWRDNPDEDIESFKLTRVTFGTAAAPYLAVRTLNQLADDEGHEHPEYTAATNAIKNCFYMDDLMTGHDDVEEAKQLCQNIKEILTKGGFIMQKWSSNEEELLKFLKEGDDTKDTIEIKLDKVIRILGLTWDRKNDNFNVTVNLPDAPHPITKRSILSDVARLFDPFGWVSPVVITAKIMIQRLWLSNLSWDDELSVDLCEEWLKYREDLTDLRMIEIPRWLQTTPRCKEVQIHGFADASSSAYAAVTYLRVVDEHDVVHVTMIASRTKVAPIKQLSIPRLELCAAVMLSEQIADVSQLLEVSHGNIFAYTDSMVVLAWLQAHPNRWKTFVANRVAEILRIIDNERWRHITTNENPADIASRGIRAADLPDYKIWWNGPEWLKSNDIEYVTNTVPATDLEEKSSFYTRQDKTHEEESPIWERFSNITRMKRVLALCKRFAKPKGKENKDVNITADEMEDILQACIRYYQNEVYGKDLKKMGKVRITRAR